MPRKLKTFITNLGFFELAVAAPSMKAALEAWGLSHNIFQHGFAKQTDDSKIVAAALAKPGIVLRRPVGTKGAFKEDADAPKVFPDGKSKTPKAATKKPSKTTRRLYDEANKMPLARRGITATSIGKKYEGKPQFLVDMACFPGSSGSPVFIFNQGGYYDRKTNSNMLGGTRLLFVGVLFAGPTITNTGQVILTHAPAVQVSSMMHLGYVVRSSEILELEKLVQAASKANLPT